jgi:4-amino-4-deoxy-L-arabinose transferase-like glycosyltransferase
MSTENITTPDHKPDLPIRSHTCFHFLKFLILPVVGLVMTAISWQKWQDLIVDFGQQAYVPWQLAEGQVLYRDIFYIYGPLSAYTHALLFKIFGSGILVLAGFNLILIAILTIILYRLLRDLSDSDTALLACLTFLLVFAFGQYKLGGNYNFVCAYVYELPHGIFLSFLTLLKLKEYLECSTSKNLGTLGLLTGLVFLTKPEVFLALSVALSAGLTLTWYLKFRNVDLRSLVLFFVGFILPGLSFIIYFSFHMPLAKAAQTIFNAWIFLLNSDLRALPLYKWIMGFNDPWGNLSTMMLYAVVLASILILIFIVNRTWDSRIRKYLLGSSALMFALIALGIYVTPHIPWLTLGRPLPFFMLLLFIYLSIRIFKNQSKIESRSITQWTLVLFALILLMKILLNAHVYHYGFVLALPATLVLVLFLAYELPLCVRRVLGDSKFYRFAMCALILIVVGNHAWMTTLTYQMKDYSVSSGKDEVIDYHPAFTPRGKVMNMTLSYIDQNLAPDQEFATFPDGIMLNYLARRRSPIADITLNPGVWILVGDDAVLDRLKQSSPPYIVYMDREFPYFGYNHFGKDYAQKIHAWIQTHYSFQAQIGATPFTDKGFGIQILKRNQT